MKMITRTFRVNPNYDKILTEEAEKLGLSVSALLNQIIRQYVLITRFSESTPSITLSYKAFAPLLEAIQDKEIEKIAEEAGSTLPEEALLQRGKELDFDSVNWFIEVVYGQYGNWFTATQNMMDGQERIHLSHQLNQKWSKFLSKYMASMFSSTLDIKPRAEIRPNSTTLYLPTNNRIKIFKDQKIQPVL
jgi:hypothetical protein